jgi:hypothetical protein
MLLAKDCRREFRLQMFASRALTYSTCHGRLDTECFARSARAKSTLGPFGELYVFRKTTKMATLLISCIIFFLSLA